MFSLFAVLLALTNAGVSAPIVGAGTAGTDCPAALAAAGPSLNGGTNGKAVTLQLPTWASAADLDLSGTFTATWSVQGSTDAITWRGISGFSSATYAGQGSTGTGVQAMGAQGIGARYICVFLSAYTSGTVVVTIEPRAIPLGIFTLLTSGSASGGAVAPSGSATNQGTANTSTNATMTVAVADKSVVHSPAAATQASASITATAGVRHIATSCTVSINTVVAQPGIIVNLRDGATGAGTILWSGVLTCPLGGACIIQTQPINLIGSTNTAMTCETAAAPAASDTATATLTYHDAG